jgi:N-acyl-D-aspartate/D-glutamate deacylase
MNDYTNRFLVVVIFAALAACSAQEGDEPQRYSVLIVNGDVYDGTLAAPRRANIGINGERIASMDAAGDAQADLIIDATGMAVMPGFIDPHTHAEDDLLNDELKANVNFLAQGVTTVFVGNDGRGLPDLEQKLAIMNRQGIGSNVAFFAGHGTARETVLGLEDRAPIDAELDAMRELVEDDMRAGALGLSTGLFYRPGSYAETDEVIELAKVAAGFGGVYDSHLRDESSYTTGLLAAVGEAIEIGEKAEIPVHIAHLKALGRDVWGRSGDLIALVEAARERGIEVTADQYPYRASGTSLQSALVPRWVMADSEDAMFERLANPDLEDRIREQMEANLWRRNGEESLLVIEHDSKWRGMTLKDIAEDMGLDPIDAAVEVVRGGNPSVASFNMNPDDVDALAIQPWVMTGSDGSSGHPRKYATYPKAYKDMVVTKKLFTLERYINRSSGLVADFFGLCDRGHLRPGMIADIAIIDLGNFEPVADFEKPTELSTGIVHLLVNGKHTIAYGQYTGTLAGTIINRQQLACPR